MKRYTRIKDRDVKLADNGELVTYSDYLALQAALREALDAWEFNSDRDWTEKTERRIAELRKQFLDEGTT